MEGPLSGDIFVRDVLEGDTQRIQHWKTNYSATQDNFVGRVVPDFMSYQSDHVVPDTMLPYPAVHPLFDIGNFEGKTTVMMRNLPNRYTQPLLIDELARTGFQGAYDFLYLPIDTGTRANKGYAFINFIHPSHTKAFKVTYEGCKLPLFNSSKHISVTLASMQGFEVNYAHYANARCNRGHPETRPLFLRDCPAVMKPSSRRRALSNSAQSKRGGSIPQTQGDSSGNTQGTWKFCTACGSNVQKDFRFCAECGTALHSA